VAPFSPGGEDFAGHPVPPWFRGQGAGGGEGLVRVGGVSFAQRFARHDQPDDVNGLPRHAIVDLKQDALHHVHEENA